MRDNRSPQILTNLDFDKDHVSPVAVIIDCLDDIENPGGEPRVVDEDDHQVVHVVHLVMIFMIRILMMVMMVMVMILMLMMVMLTKVMLTMVWNMMMRESLVRGGCNCNARAASLGDPQVSPDVPTLEYQCHPC